MKRRKIENKRSQKRPRGNPNWKRGGPSPNPGGRPREEREVVEALRLHGDELVAALLKLAIGKKPNVKAIAEAFNRAYGKAKQVVELTGTGGGPLRIDLKNLSKEDLDALEAIATRATAKPG